MSPDPVDRDLLVQQIALDLTAAFEAALAPYAKAPDVLALGLATAITTAHYLLAWVTASLPPGGQRYIIDSFCDAVREAALELQLAREAVPTAEED